MSLLNPMNPASPVSPLNPYNALLDKTERTVEQPQKPLERKDAPPESGGFAITIILIVMVVLSGMALITRVLKP